MTVRDNGYDALVAALEDLVTEQRRVGLRRVAVGITQASGGRVHSDDLTVLEIATVHEFGVEFEDSERIIPERSWLRGWFDSDQDFIADEIRKAARSVFQGRVTRDRALQLLGQLFVGRIRERITRGDAFEPLAQITIDRKGSTTPLIDEGILLASIVSELRDG